MGREKGGAAAVLYSTSQVVQAVTRGTRGGQQTNFIQVSTWALRNSGGKERLTGRQTDHDSMWLALEGQLYFLL